MASVKEIPDALQINMTITYQIITVDCIECTNTTKQVIFKADFVSYIYHMPATDYDIVQ